LYHQSLI
jgi:nucleotidyltransferase/DNA polymerase involved in DNA repair